MASKHKQRKRAPVAQQSAQCPLCRKTYKGPADEELFESCNFCQQEVCEGCAAYRWYGCGACDSALINLKAELKALNAARQQRQLEPRVLELVLSETAAALYRERAELLRK